MSVQIVGGSSGSRKISIVSDQFVSTARIDDSGDIVCVVKPISRLRAFFAAHPRLPLPKTVKMAMFIIEGLTPFGRIIALAFLALLIGPVFWSKPLVAMPFSVSQTVHLLAMQLGLMSIIMGLVSSRIGRWHGAEHMVIAAHEKRGATGIDDIRGQERVHAKCGGRFIAPFMVGQTLANVASRVTGTDPVFAYLLAMEAVLWIDAIWGLERIRVTAWLSSALQRYVTTAAPGMIEILTAKTAMDELLAAHAESDAVE